MVSGTIGPMAQQSCFPVVSGTTMRVMASGAIRENRCEVVSGTTWPRVPPCMRYLSRRPCGGNVPVVSGTTKVGTAECSAAPISPRMSAEALDPKGHAWRGRFK